MQEVQLEVLPTAPVQKKAVYIVQLDEQPSLSLVL